MSQERLSGIRRIKKSRQADRFLGALSSDEADWLRRAIKRIATGEADVYPSLLFPHLYYGTAGAMVLRLSVKGDLMVVTDIKRTAG